MNKRWLCYLGFHDWVYTEFADFAGLLTRGMRECQRRDCGQRQMYRIKTDNER